MDYTLLQHYWWLIISLLGALLVFLLFVQGGQTLIYQIGKTELERTMLINSIGRKWEFTFTTLVTFGGAFFASFPLFYSTSFGGAYWVWMAILFCFIIQAVSFEFRTKAGNFLGSKTYESFLLINGFGGVFLLGTAVGTFFTGSEFTVNMNNLTDVFMPVISTWDNPLHGLEALLNPRNLLLGGAVLFLARTLGALYFINNIDDDTIFERSKRQVMVNAIVFLALFLPFLIWTLLSNGYSLDPVTGNIFMEKYKYAINYIEMPIIGAILLIGVVLVLIGIGKTVLSTKYNKGIWFSGLGTILTVLSLFLILGYNNTSYYPSSSDLQSSLTIFNSSSSEFTLTVMSYVSIIIPFVLAYIFYAWRSLDRKPIDRVEMSGSDHKY
ncbi:MAG: cytochrome d ubiquinol oxidase subunit II [Bacteroidales bacterium]